MHFASDNWAGAHPAIADNLARRNGGFVQANGGSDFDRAVEQTFRDIFETDLSVHYVATGTAANALALSAVARPGGIILCHSEAHIRVDECGAPEFFGAGTRLESIDGELGRFDATALEAAIGHVKDGGLNAGQVQAVSVTQLTEAGTAYDLDAIGAIADVTRHHGLPLHMDGARFANALVALGCTPAQMSWKAGVDILSFGATKNGCWCADAVLVFNPDHGRQMDYLCKRSGHMASKARFVSAQFEAYFADGLWLEMAAHANRMGARVAGIVGARNRFRLAWQPQGNEVFAIGPQEAVDGLAAKGVQFSPWQPPRAERPLVGAGEAMIRLVASFASTDADLEALESALAG
ncbi:MAG: low specificity L-threonine aldolase [Roseitalea sp.]|jgi:threonine aldolase|nr:low specificity L-threonine aldolase [Roseitalea sp.]MBO6723794.1 low specificity L-threonine aldolase [Roseitalea sp.]MBO6741918.1 low specificity L-threonine aldolase [Roseitalea sp.]